MKIEEIIEDFAEQKERAIRSHPVDWTAFRIWEEELQRELQSPVHDSFKNFRVGPEIDEVAIYADGLWDEKNPL